MRQQRQDRHAGRDLPARRSVADFDSASAFLRASARGLRGEGFDRLGQGRLPAAGARLSGLLPESVRRWVYTAAGAAESVPANRLGDIDSERVADWVVNHYDAAGRYPMAFVGSSNGALTHLCTALGAPWLPQTMLVPVRWPGNDPDLPDAALRFGAATAGPLLERNPDLALHHMHDPNQDRLMVGRMAYFRVKRRRLGAAYRRFLADTLAEGAPLVLVDDRSRWPVTDVAERHVFQAGARGGLEPSEYRHGSDRLARFQRAQGSTRDTPRTPAPDRESAEAEWGFADELADDVLAFAEETGHPVYRLRLAEPEALSPVVAELLRRRGTGRRLLVESFILVDPVRAARIGAAPFWTVFGVEPSADALERYLDRVEPYERIDIVLFNHGVRSAGLADVDRWRALARRATVSGRLLGVRPDRYPADFASLVRYSAALRHIPDAPVRRVDPPSLTELAAEIDRWPGVEWLPAGR